MGGRFRRPPNPPLRVPAALAVVLARGETWARSVVGASGSALPDVGQTGGILPPYVPPIMLGRCLLYCQGREVQEGPNEVCFIIAIACIASFQGAIADAGRAGWQRCGWVSEGGCKETASPASDDIESRCDGRGRESSLRTYLSSRLQAQGALSLSIVSGPIPKPNQGTQV